jgi:hypothetical protein
MGVQIMAENTRIHISTRTQSVFPDVDSVMIRIQIIPIMLVRAFFSGYEEDYRCLKNNYRTENIQMLET